MLISVSKWENMYSEHRKKAVMHCVGSPVRKSCWEEDNPSKEIPHEPCFVQLDVTSLCGRTYMK